MDDSSGTCKLGKGSVVTSEAGDRLIYHTCHRGAHYAIEKNPDGAVASSVYPSAHPASVAVDGLEPEPWAAFSFISEWRPRPWLQIDLASTHLVGRVRLALGQEPNGFPGRNAHLEIKVGDTDVTERVSDDTELLCDNSLCYRIGVDFERVKDVQCVEPLQGHFVTIQKYDHWLIENWNSVLEVLEVDIFGSLCTEACGKHEQTLDRCELVSDCQCERQKNHKRL